MYVNESQSMQPTHNRTEPTPLIRDSILLGLAYYDIWSQHFGTFV